MKEGWTQPTTKDLRAAFSLNGTAYFSVMIGMLERMRDDHKMLTFDWDTIEGINTVRIRLNDIEYDNTPDDSVVAPKALANKTVTQEYKLLRYFTSLQFDVLGVAEKGTTKNHGKMRSLLNRPGATLKIAKACADAYWKMPTARRKGDSISGFCYVFESILADAIEEDQFERERDLAKLPKTKLTEREYLEREIARAVEDEDDTYMEMLKTDLEKLNAEA